MNLQPVPVRYRRKLPITVVEPKHIKGCFDNAYNCSYILCCFASFHMWMNAFVILISLI